jgi:hypothetical protein
MADNVAWGSSRKDGSFSLIGDIASLPCEIALSAAYYTSIGDGGISVYGLCSTLTGCIVKFKNEDEKYEELKTDGELVRFDILNEEVKKYGKVKKPSDAGKFHYSVITAKYKESERFSCRINFDVNPQVLSMVTTKQSSKGKPINDEVLEELIESLYSYGDASPDALALLDAGKPGEKRGGGGYGNTTVVKTVTPDDRLLFIVSALCDSDTVKALTQGKHPGDECFPVLELADIATSTLMELAKDKPAYAETMNIILDYCTR